MGFSFPQKRTKGTGDKPPPVVVQDASRVNYLSSTLCERTQLVSVKTALTTITWEQGLYRFKVPQQDPKRTTPPPEQ